MADTYDEQGNLLNSAPGLGLASAPGTPMMGPDPWLGDVNANDPNRNPSGALNFSAPPQQATPQMTASLGLATPEPRSQSEQDYISSLPALQRFGLAMGELEAHLEGRQSPIDRLLATRRNEQHKARVELAQTTQTFMKAMEDLKKYDPASVQGKAVLNAYKRALPPEFAGALDAVGTEQEETLKGIVGLVADPDVQNALVKVCGRDRACWQKQVNDKDWLAQQYQTVDTKRMATALPKLRAFKEQVIDKGGLDAKKAPDGTVTLSWPELVEGNAKLQLFTDAEMDTFRRNPDYLIPYGIKTTKALAAGELEAAKVAERPTKEDFKEGATRRILDPAGTELQQEFKGGKWVTIGRRKDKATDKPLTLAQENHDERVLKAREAIKGISKEEMIKKRERFLPNGKENKDYDPDLARNWRLAGEPLFADRKAERDAAKAAPKTEAAPKPPTAPVRLSEGDRTKLLNEATAAVNKGADPEAVKKRLKEKYGIDATFTRKKK